MGKRTILLALSGLFLLLPGLNLGLGPHLQSARWDLTEDKLYSISPGTLNIIESLSAPVELTLYFSREAAATVPALRSFAQQVEALLREYERQSQGKVKLNIIDPLRYSNEEDEARAFNLSSMPLGEGGAPVYFGLVAASEKTRWKSLPMLSLDEQRFLEYDVSRLLQSLNGTQKMAVGVISTLPVTAGVGLQARAGRPSWLIMEEIAKTFDIQELPISVTAIPATLQTLMLIHPKRLPVETLKAIDQFVLRGGRLLVFVDPYSEQDPGALYFGIPSKDRASNMGELFAAWGFKLRPGQVVGDRVFGQYVTVGEGSSPVWQPTALALRGDAINQQDVVTAGLEEINLTTVGILEPDAGARTVFTPLLRSSANAGALPTSSLDHLADPAELARQFQPGTDRFTLAARIEGPASSAYVKAEQAKAGELSEAAMIHVIAVADTDLLSDGTWVDVQSRYGKNTVMPWADNGQLVLNALDNLAGSDALIGLRARGYYHRPFTVVEQLQNDARMQLDAVHAQLDARLRDTEQKLAELQRENKKNDELSPEQRKAVESFSLEKQQLDTQMRQAARDFNVRVEELGWLIKVLNIAALPALIFLVLLGTRLVLQFVGRR